MSMGWDTITGIDTVNPTTAAFETLSNTLGAEAPVVDPGGMRGIRDHQSERCRQGNETIRGAIEMEPSPEELALLLEWILGGTKSGNNYPIADTLSSRYVQLDRIAKVHTYAGVYVNQATFRGSEGQPVRLTLDLIGQTETEGNAGTFPAITPLTTPPFMFAEGVLTLMSSARSFQDFTLTINNALETKFYNSRTATRIIPTDRIVSFEASVPYDTNSTGLYGPAVAGAAATLVFTPPSPHSGYSLTFTFGAMQFAKRPATVNGKGELMLPLSGIARRLTTTPSLAITLDSAP